MEVNILVKFTQNISYIYNISLGIIPNSSLYIGGGREWLRLVSYIHSGYKSLETMGLGNVKTRLQSVKEIEQKKQSLIFYKG